MPQVDRSRLLFTCAAIAAIAAAPAYPARGPFAGHFNVPHGATHPRPVGGANGVITNPGFESGNIDGGWYQCGDVSAYITMEHPYRGSFDEYSGTRNGKGEPLGNSGVCQHVTIPRNAILTAHLYQLSDEGDTAFSYQEADLLDDRGNVVVNLYRSTNHRSAWVEGLWNLGAYAGRTFWLYFGVHGDGYAQHSTQQFVDDVGLAGAASPAPQ